MSAAINNATPTAQPPKTEKPSIFSKLLHSLIERIKLLAKQVFYYLVPPARKTFNVVLIQYSDLIEYDIKQFLSKHLPYRHNINAQEFTSLPENEPIKGKNYIARPMGLGSSELMLDAEMQKVINQLDDKTRLMILFDKEAPPLVGEQWDPLVKGNMIYDGQGSADKKAACLKQFFGSL